MQKRQAGYAVMCVALRLCVWDKGASTTGGMKMTNITAITTELAANGFVGKPWIKGDMVRIYLDAGRKDAKVYLDLEVDGEIVIGAALKVFVDAGRQSYKWAATQNQIVRERFSAALNCYVRAVYKPEDAIEGSGYGASIRDMIAQAFAEA